VYTTTRLKTVTDNHQYGAAIKISGRELMDGEYERTWRSRIDDESREVQLRFGLTTERGVPVRFLVQLEYRHDGEWLPVARFDHDRDGPTHRNATICGLHLDIHAPDGSQKRKITDFPPIDNDCSRLLPVSAVNGVGAHR